MKRAILVALLGAVAAAAIVAVTAFGKSNDDHLGKINHIVVVYEENHSFDNLYGGWEGVNGRANATAAHIDADRPGRDRLHLPDAERRQPDVAAARRDLHRHDARAPRSRARFTERARSTIEHVSCRPSARTCPQPGGFFPNGSLPNAANLPGGCTRRHRAPLLPGAVPAEQRQAEPLHDRQRRGRA